MDIATGYDTPIVARVWNRSRDPFQGQLSIFDLRSRRRLSDFPVVYRSGRGRFALSNDMLRCFIGCYETHGLAAYSAQDGSVLWRRKDLQALQRVASFPFSDVVFCRCQDSEAFLLSASTGRTLDIQHGIKHVYSSPFGKTAIVSARTLELHEPFGTLREKILRMTYAELDCAFSETEAVITEAGGLLRCFDLASGELVWSHTPQPGTHFVHLSFCYSLNCFVGIRWDLEDSRAISRVLHFDRQSGAVLRDVPLNTDALYRFCLGGKHLFTQYLRVMDVATGEVIQQFQDHDI